jgi:hypothetical protein
LFKFRIALAALLLCIGSGAANAAIVSADPVSIEKYTAYGVGSGDLIIWLSGGSLSGCDGVWISASQPGARNLTTTMMLAKAMSKNVSIAADNSTLWTGSSSSNFCSLYLIQML